MSFVLTLVEYDKLKEAEHQIEINPLIIVPIVIYGIFICFLIYGLHKRRFWGWTCNWIHLGMTVLLNAAISKQSWGVYMVTVILLSLIFFLPNYIYFKKRRLLFAGRSSTVEKLANHKTGTNFINTYYQVLGLKITASKEEVRQAYKDLLTVWNPSRFEDSHLQNKARKKIKGIDEAYEKLIMYISGKHQRLEAERHPKEEKEEKNRAEESRRQDEIKWKQTEEESRAKRRQKQIIVVSALLGTVLILIVVILKFTAQVPPTTKGSKLIDDIGVFKKETTDPTLPPPTAGKDRIINDITPTPPTPPQTKAPDAFWDLIESLKPITNSLGMKFVYIPPGTFMMGSPSNEAGRYDNETQHKVTLTKGYHLGVTEVTQGQWKALMGSNPSNFKNCGDDCPVEMIDWHDVQKFIRRLNELEKTDRYRLPTEAEWEYACRAGTETALYSGPISILGENNAPALDTVAWYSGNSCVDYEGGSSNCSLWPEKQYSCKRCGVHPVGLKKPNAWGLHDMLGNVLEWCEDWFGDYPEGEVTDPKATSGGSGRVIRGGCWNYKARQCRSAYRISYPANFPFYNAGFRLLRAE